ncbi:MAG: chemotaxis protein [Cellvibrionaceae bacterium]|nr:chemotaxis protein [Cellvibrionaceae bacterium]|tara:strand:- start:4609 stop:5481 length:873 start_codon:yes stop_codon:yes gene_type:complete
MTSRQSTSLGASAGSFQLEAEEFESFRRFLQDACGIFLAENKQYLVTTRIRKILSDNQLPSLAALVDQMRLNRHSKLRDQVIDAMTTNETFWFRDTYPYDYLSRQLFMELQERRDFGSIRIWSAACSSGQEPYSISMVADECRRKERGAFKRPLEIVATDLSSSMLDQAKLGEYDRMSVVRGLSRERLDAYFDKLPNDVWRVKPLVGNCVQFRALNLMDSFAGLGKFDIIFCRNVLIYFSGDLKVDILKRMHAALKPGGVLFLGSSEGLAGAAHLFEMVHSNPGILYRAL